MQTGLKVWASNFNYIQSARVLSEQGFCDFLELYVDPLVDENKLGEWRGVSKDIRLHAPHSWGGFNPAQASGLEQNCALLHKVEMYRSLFRPKTIIFHPGTNGSLEEAIAQFNVFREGFPGIFQVALIENKPKVGLKGEDCVGASPDEIRQLIDKVDFRFCLDIGHAICYAAWAGRAWQDVVKDFIKINPSAFHLSDGFTASMHDKHLHFGRGDFDLHAILSMFPLDASITIETPHDHSEDLDDFCDDVAFLRKVGSV